MHQQLGKEYLEHVIFDELAEAKHFYQLLSDSVMGFVTSGTYAVINIDCYMFSSMEGTIDSIHTILKKGRINDAYALLRKFYDSAVINIYTALYLKDHFDMNNVIVEKVDEWIKGKQIIPRFSTMSAYIIDHNQVMSITNMLFEESQYKNSIYEEIRKRCNGHMHYNSYYSMLLNDNAIYLEKRLQHLEQFGEDFNKLYLLHLSYLFIINEVYMASSDYRDHMEMSMEPPEGSQYWVAEFVQNTFDRIIKKDRQDIATFIKSHTGMELK